MDIVTESPIKPQNGTFTSPLCAHKLPLEGSSYSVYNSDSDVSQSDSEFASAGLPSARRNPHLQSSLPSVQTTPEPEVYVTAADSFAGLSLADAMPRYMIRLEREKDAALARNEPRQPPRRLVADSQPSLDSVLVPHKSKLEKDKEAAIAENNPRKPPSRTFEEQPSLDSVLVPFKSRLQREKEAAQAADEPRRPAVRNIENEQPALDSMLKKSYSRVEREKQASAAAAAADPSTATAIRPPRSRLQMEREASARLADKSRIQDEEIAAIKAAEAEVAAAAAAEAAAIEAEEAEGAAAAAALLESPVAEGGEELYDTNMMSEKFTEDKEADVPVATPAAVQEVEIAAEDILVAKVAEEEEEEAVFIEAEQEVNSALVEEEEHEEEIPAVDNELDTDVAVAEKEE